MPKYIIGCELNERYCQVSYYNEEQQEPLTLENVFVIVYLRKQMRTKGKRNVYDQQNHIEPRG